MRKLYLIDGRIVIKLFHYSKAIYPEAIYYSCNCSSRRSKHEGNWTGWIRIRRWRMTFEYIWRRKPFLVCYMQAYTPDGFQYITRG